MDTLKVYGGFDQTEMKPHHRKAVIIILSIICIIAIGVLVRFYLFSEKSVNENNTVPVPTATVVAQDPVAKAALVKATEDTNFAKPLSARESLIKEAILKTINRN